MENQASLIILAAVLGVFAMIMTILIIFLLKNTKGKGEPQSITNPRRENVKDEEVLCPCCKKVMFQGYTLSPRGLYFYSRDTKPTMFKLAYSNFMLKNTMDWSFRMKPRENMAWRCPECNVVTIDHNQFINQ